MHHQTSAAFEFTIPISTWALWQQDDANTTPDIGFVEPSLRRKLSLLSKMTLNVAYACVENNPKVRVVFASRHGDLTRTHKMLEDLTVSEPLSPTAFSMAVLNASIGVQSILQQNTMPSTAISAGNESFGMGLLEAFLTLKSHPDTPVLLIYAEDTTPGTYQSDDLNTYKPHALALLLDTQNAKLTVSIKAYPTNTAATSPLKEPMSLKFYQSIDHLRQTRWEHLKYLWTWDITHAHH